MSFLVRALKGTQMLKVGQKVRLLPYEPRCPDHGHVITHDFEVGAELHILPTNPVYAAIPIDDVPPGLTPWDVDGDFYCMDRSDPDLLTRYVHHSQLEVID